MTDFVEVIWGFKKYGTYPEPRSADGEVIILSGEYYKLKIPTYFSKKVNMK